MTENNLKYLFQVSWFPVICVGFEFHYRHMLLLQNSCLNFELVTDFHYGLVGCFCNYGQGTTNGEVILQLVCVQSYIILHIVFRLAF